MYACIKFWFQDDSNFYVFGNGNLYKFESAMDSFTQVTDVPNGIDLQDPTSVAILVDSCLFPNGIGLSVSIVHLTEINVFLGWTAWVSSDCSVSCGGGLLNRTRNCLDDEGMIDSDESCEGDAIETISCETQQCPGMSIRKSMFISRYYVNSI